MLESDAVHTVIPFPGVSKEKHKPKSSKYEKSLIKRGIFIPPGMYESRAFGLLRPSAILILLRFIQKQRWHKEGKGRSKRIVYDKGGLVFTYAEAEALGISRSTFLRGLNALIELGFLDVEHQGGAYGHDYSRYALSERWRDYGTPTFKASQKKRRLQPGLDVNSRINAMKKASEKEAI